MQQLFKADSVQEFRIAPDMPPVGPKLKALRLSARPPISIRGMADALGIPHASYNFYEREQAYKKPYLPMDFTRKVAAILAERGVDPADVMKLTGMTDGEVEPEARVIEAALPQVHFISLPIALPSEAALSDMFESLLALVPEDATRAEAARILAQRLPSGFAAIGPFVIDQGMRHATGSAAVPQSPATDHPAPEQPSRT
jgi:hypothetical protein